MTPVNSKSLFVTIMDKIEKLGNDEIDTQKAIAFSKLFSNATTLMDYELKRTAVQMKLVEMGQLQEARIRDIESKRFDDAKAGEFIEGRKYIVQ